MAGPHQACFTWRNFPKKSDCVTWAPVTVRIEVSAGGLEFHPKENLKPLAQGCTGWTYCPSLNQVDPTDTILSRMRHQGILM